MAFNDNELLTIQVKAFQSYLPDTVKYRGKEHALTHKEKLACGRAVWYIIQKGYGIGSAVPMASGSFDVAPIKVERAVRSVFPDEYFQHLEKSKNKVFVNELHKELDGAYEPK